MVRITGASHPPDRSTRPPVGPSRVNPENREAIAITVSGRSSITVTCALYIKSALRAVNAQLEGGFAPLVKGRYALRP